MKNKVLKVLILSFIVFLLLGLSVIIVNAQFTQIPKDNTKALFKGLETLDMLIFISPQYKNDDKIISSINAYINTLNEDLGWNAKIIKIDEKENFYETIDKKIEFFYNIFNIKCCLMVGEDINTPLAGDIDYMEKPSIIPWATIGGKKGYESNERGIVSKEYKINICISLLYPTHEEKYEIKSKNIISAFEKFSKQRNDFSFSNISVFESLEISKNSKAIYQKLNDFSKLNYKQEPNDSDLKDSINKYNSLFFVHGHSNPVLTQISDDTLFTAEIVDEINSPFFCADGCYVSGWWSDKKDNDILDTSIKSQWYGSKIFTSKNVKIMALGLLSQNGYLETVSFVENVVPVLLKGNTVAESIIGQTFTGDFVLYGDPSFHFTN